MKKKVDMKPETKLIRELLLDARNNLIKNDDCMREILSNLTGIDKQKWTRQQCKTAFESILGTVQK